MEETPTPARRTRSAKAAASKTTKVTKAGKLKAIRRPTTIIDRMVLLDKTAAVKFRSQARSGRSYGYVTVTGRGTVALPPAVRKRYHLDQPGSQVEITEREDGILELRPMIAVPADQAWFWTKEWQEGERQVDAEIAAGLGTTYDNAEDFMAHLDDLDAEASAREADE